MPDEDDPYDLERYWDRIRGPRPKTAAEAPPRAPDPNEKFRTMSSVWAAPMFSTLTTQEQYGRRIQVTDVKLVEGGIEIHCVFPAAERDCVMHGVALWESPMSVQPLAVASFEPSSVLQGDLADVTVKIEL
jgi:hypothetical protein